MLGLVKKVVRKGLRLYNQALVYAPRGEVTGADLNEDLPRLIREQNPVLFDVGANAGQSITFFRKIFPDSRIYAFEPSSATFRKLASKPFGDQFFLHNFALGREASSREFINYRNPSLSSFLTLDVNPENRFRQEALASKETVEIRTLDDFLPKNNIARVDLLKIDTQGFDLEVLLGSVESLRKGLIQNVFVELNFIQKYENQARAMDIMDLMTRHDFRLVDFYHKVRQNQVLAWCDGLFSRRPFEAAP